MVSIAISCLIFSRYTRPLPPRLVQLVKEELFEGELTDEEQIEENCLYVSPNWMSVTTHHLQAKTEEKGQVPEIQANEPCGRNSVNSEAHRYYGM